MAMSVAENVPVAIERTPRSAQQQLAIGSVLGALYVLAGLWIVLAGLPLVWNALTYGSSEGAPLINEFLSATLVMMICGLAAVGFGSLGYRLITSQTLHGLRAGIFFAAIMMFASLWIAEAAGNLFEERGAMDPTAGMIVTLVL